MRLADKIRQIESEKIPFDHERVREIVEAYFTKYPQGSFTVYFDGREIKPYPNVDYDYVMPRCWFEPYRSFMNDEGFIMDPSYGRSGYEMTWRLY